MRDSKLRKMIADCLRYIKHLNKGKFGYGWIPRDTVEVHVETYYTTYSSVSLADVILGIDPIDYDSIFIRGSSYVDRYDGMDSSQVELYSYRKQTDQEYFDSICSYILPAKYQQEKYETYLQLKKLFEG